MSQSTQSPASGLQHAAEDHAVHESLLSIRDLSIWYSADAPTVHGVNLDIAAGQITSLVGESGSGKSTVVKSVLGFLPATAWHDGQIRVGGSDTSTWSESQYSLYRGWYLGFVPQDPGVSLNPVKRIGRQVAEAVRVNSVKGKPGGRHRTLSDETTRQRVIDALELAGLSQAEKILEKYPHELSGGMKQRVLIAIALAGDPQLILADEPTSALDVTVQEQILDHLDELRRTLDIGILLVTHDLGVALDRSDHIVVMRSGEVVDHGDPIGIAGSHTTEYTQQLFAAAPGLTISNRSDGDQRERNDSGIDVSVDRGRPAHAIGNDQGSERADTVIAVAGVSKAFDGATGSVQAVDHVSLSVGLGTTHALVGESGAGKSTLARIIAGLERADSGTVAIDGLLRGEPEADRRLRQRLQVVYQNPFSSLDPRYELVELVAEPLEVHRPDLSRRQRRARAISLLDQVGIPQRFGQRLAGQLSGGQAQRVAIARALAISPKIVVLDEAVSSLDVSVQARILDLLADLQTEKSLTYVFITHDLGVVHSFADDVTILRRGAVVEQGSVAGIFNSPQADYTKQLLAAIPGKTFQQRLAASGRAEAVA